MEDKDGGGGAGGGDGSGSNVSDGEQWGAADEALLARPTTHLLLCGPVPNRPRTGLFKELPHVRIFKRGSVLPPDGLDINRRLPKEKVGNSGYQIQ